MDLLRRLLPSIILSCWCAQAQIETTSRQYDPSILIPASPDLDKSKLIEIPRDRDNYKKAEAGDPSAQYLIGQYYRLGELVSSNATEAVNWFRKAAEQGHPQAQRRLADCYATGVGVEKNTEASRKWYTQAANNGDAESQHALGMVNMFESVEDANRAEEAIAWYRKAAEQGYGPAQVSLAIHYGGGLGVKKDTSESLKWYRAAATAGFAPGQFGLAMCYLNGDGIIKDSIEAVNWLRRAAEQGHPGGQYYLGLCYVQGKGLAADNVQAHFWLNLASAQGHADAKKLLVVLEKNMAPAAIIEAEQLARDFKPGISQTADSRGPNRKPKTAPSRTGSAFFISDDGYLLTSAHVVGNSSRIDVKTKKGISAANVIKTDPANDVALLKVTGFFSALPLVTSRSVRLGDSVSTMGFPNTAVQGLEPKLTRGEINSLYGMKDDPRHFQISAAVQPGNSGGPLIDSDGNVVGIVKMRLDDVQTLKLTGSLPQNVNYALKSSFAFAFLENLSDVAIKLKSPASKGQSFEEIVKTAEDSIALVLVYE